MKTKTWLIVAVSLVAVGGLLFTGVMTVLGWDFSKLSTIPYETNEYSVEQPFQNIEIYTDTADVVFVPSDSPTITCYEQAKVKHDVRAEFDTLTIQVKDTRKWYEYIGISFGSPKITVQLPAGTYGSLTIKGSTGDVEIPQEFTFEKINVTQSTGDVTLGASVTGNVVVKTSTGQIRMNGVSASSVTLSVSTGKTVLTDVRVKRMKSSGNTGDIVLQNVILDGLLWIQRSTGDVKLKDVDAKDLSIRTDTGDVRGNLLSDKIFFTRTDTGEVTVPQTTTGGKCEIMTDTGDIHITVTKEKA